MLIAKPSFVEVILPLSLEGTFTYHLLKDDLNKVKIGQRVAVPFGARKLYTGIIHSIHQNKPELYKTKGIHAFLDDEPLVTPLQVSFWEWIANYYMCTLGDVYRNAFPSSLKLESQTYIKLLDAKAELNEDLSDKEYLIYEALKLRHIISVDEAAQIIDEHTSIPVLKTLIDKGIIQLDEKLHEKYTPKIENFIRLHPQLKSDEKQFIAALEQLQNAPKQREALLKLISLESQKKGFIKTSSFAEFGISQPILKTLADKNYVEIYQLQTSRVDGKQEDTVEIHQLTSEQEEAYQQIQKLFTTKNTVLLHGVTSSGKTEIYLKMIEDVISKGGKVLYLLPEIAVTTQIVHRIRKHFGEKVGVYHSKFNQNERVELWQKTLHNEYDIVIGARSSIFLPFSDLRLILVDEEHESSYKQQDQKPFYQARDMALLLATLFEAKVILGSATPSVESYHNAIEGKFGYVTLKKRFGGIQLPKTELIDLKKSLKRKEITEDVSHLLRDEIQEALDTKKQVIIFQNRRGYAPVLECQSCGHTPYCPNCDVSLTYHKFIHQLKCHYCSFAQVKPIRCPSCQSNELMTKGIGTEQIENQLLNIFPKARIKRMDVDTMRGKHAFEKLIESFEKQEIDILVGTQMLTKGLDFGNVSLVGVIRADSLLNFPAFRAHERAFQLLTQVAGRSGRREERGKVLIQTYNPEHQILQNVTLHDYEATVKDILYERRTFLYPPFVRLIQLRFKHAKKERVDKTANQLVKLLKPFMLGNHLLGPEAPVVGRINNLYIVDVMIKIPPEVSVNRIKTILKNQLEILNTVTAYRSVRLDIDVDPN